MIEVQSQYIDPSHQLPLPEEPYNVTNEFAALPKKPSLAEALFDPQKLSKLNPLNQFAGQILLGFEQLGFNPDKIAIFIGEPRNKKPESPKIKNDFLIQYFLKQIGGFYPDLNRDFNNDPHPADLNALLRSILEMEKKRGNPKWINIKNKNKDKIINKKKPFLDDSF